MIVKTIALKITSVGKGIVNKGGQEEQFSRWDVKTEKKNNFNLAKTALYNKIDEDGTKRQVVKVKISSNCARNAMFQNEQPFQTSHLFANIESQIHLLLCSKSMLARGYLFAVKNGTIKRKSPVTVSDAVQINDSVLKLETCSTSGARTDTAYFLNDSVGEVVYENSVIIDLGELAFLSCDEVFGRPAFHPDDWGKMRPILEKNLGCDLPNELSYYTKKTSDLPLGEKGVLLPKAAVKSLVTYVLQRTLDLSITRASGFMQTTGYDVYLQDEKAIGLNFSKRPDNHFNIEAHTRDDIEDFVAGLDFIETYRLSTELEASDSRAYVEAIKVAKTEKEAKKSKKNAKGAASNTRKVAPKDSLAVSEASL